MLAPEPIVVSLLLGNALFSCRAPYVAHCISARHVHACLVLVRLVNGDHYKEHHDKQNEAEDRHLLTRKRLLKVRMFP